MDTQERASAFVAAIRALSQQYGMELYAVLQAEQLGEALLTKPVLSLRPLKDWTPTEEPTDGNVGE